MRNPFNRNVFGQAPDLSAYGVGQESSQAAGVDERVRQALVAKDYPYQITAGHNFAVTLIYKSEGRSQLVYIASNTRTVRGKEWRRLWSWAFDVPGRLPWDQALALLDESNLPLLGSWFTSVENNTTSVGFHMRVPADAPPAELDAAIQAVAEAADDLEKATVGTDDK